MQIEWASVSVLPVETPKTTVAVKPSFHAAPPGDVLSDVAVELAPDAESDTSESDVLESDASNFTPQEIHAMLQEDVNTLCTDIDEGDLVGQYLKEAGSHRLLSRAEEVEFFQKIECGKKNRETFSDFHGTPEKRLKFIQEIAEGDAAEETVILHNMRLVISVAKRYLRDDVKFLDLIQEGNVGLIRAAKKFDYRRGYEFATFATWWVRQAITRYIANNKSAMRLPTNLNDVVVKMTCVQYDYEKRFGSVLPDSALAQVMGISVDDVLKLKKHHERSQVVSLDTPVKDDEGQTLTIGDKQIDPVSVEESGNNQLMSEFIQQMIDVSLSPLNAKVLRLKFGLESFSANPKLQDQGLSLEAVGKKMGLTKDQVRLIMERSMAKLQQMPARNKLSEGFVGTDKSRIPFPIRQYTETIQNRVHHIERLNRSQLPNPDTTNRRVLRQAIMDRIHEVRTKQCVSFYLTLDSTLSVEERCKKTASRWDSQIQAVSYEIHRGFINKYGVTSLDELMKQIRQDERT